MDNPLTLSFADYFDPSLFWFHSICVGVFGALFGSFFNVCIYRIPKGVPLSLPPSHCYQCGQPLKWWHNIPLVSYWLQLGRCRFCGVRYSMRYFFVELLTCALFLSVFWLYALPPHGSKDGYSPVVISGMIFISLLIIPTFTDIDHWIIPDRISLGGTFAGLALAAIPPLALARHNPLGAGAGLLPLPPMWAPLGNAALGAVFGFSMLWLVGAAGRAVFRKEAMGMGDVKLMAMFGAFCGPVNCVLIFMLACLIGLGPGITGVVLDAMAGAGAGDSPLSGLTPDGARQKRMLERHGLDGPEWLATVRALANPGAVGSSRHHLPFVPWLSLAALIVFLFWERIHQAFGLDLLLKGYY